jgi:hypothetical protein
MQPIATEFRKWQKWAERIKDDVEQRLIHPRQVFRLFAETVNANAAHIEENDGEVFVRFVQRCYVSHVVMAIRGHVKEKKESISFMRLLREIHNCAPRFTFDFFLTQFPIDPLYVDWQTPTFSRFSEDGKVVSPTILQSDISTLERQVGEIENLGDRAIAHLDKRGLDGLVTFRDLDACIDAFDNLICKYLGLIKGSGYATLEPTILADWERIFTVPLDNGKSRSQVR